MPFLKTISDLMLRLTFSKKDHSAKMMRYMMATEAMNSGGECNRQQSNHTYKKKSNASGGSPF
jgi:hypothetical protein